MRNGIKYRVTRSGRDVYRGEIDGLLEAARGGEVLANDLIFDPTIEKWVFARSLGVLTGFPLKGRRSSGGSDTDETETRATLSEGALRKRARRRRTFGQVAALALMIGSAVVLIFLIPAKKDRTGGNIDRFVDSSPSGQMRIEGTGEGLVERETAKVGPSNMDDKDVVINGTEADGPLAPSAGRKAVLDGPVEAKGATAGAAKPQGSGNEGPGDALPTGPAGEPSTGVPVEPGQPAPRGDASAQSRNLIQLPEPKPTTPGQLPVEYRDESNGKTIVRPRGRLSQAEIQAQVDAARGVLQDSRTDDAETTMDDLIRARFQAESAVKRLQNTRANEITLREAQNTIKALSKALLSLCTTMYDDEYCALKSQHPAWPEVVLRNVRRNEALIGMSVEQLEAAWGSPVSREQKKGSTLYCFSSPCEKSARVMSGLVVEVKPGAVKKP